MWLSHPGWPLHSLHSYLLRVRSARVGSCSLQYSAAHTQAAKLRKLGSWLGLARSRRTSELLHFVLAGRTRDSRASRYRPVSTRAQQPIGLEHCLLSLRRSLEW